MNNFNIQKLGFLDELNTVLHPVLEVVESDRNSFEVRLRFTKYADETQINTTNEMDKLIESLAIKYFNELPQFNNTHRWFWFSNVGQTDG